MSKQNIKLTIQYDGTDYSGWQIQKNQKTVQGELKKIIEQITLSSNVNIIGSGRTDAGVHAIAQIANFQTNSTMTCNQFTKAINSKINNDIVILKSSLVDSSFNSRFSAKSREYVYNICTIKTPFNFKYNWIYKNDINRNLLEKCSEIVRSENDFSNFCKHSQEVKNYLCNVSFSKWIFLNDTENTIQYKIKANRFLHHMVRMLVGTMLEVSRGRITIGDFKNIFSNPKLKNMVLTAPANGLYLSKISYE